MTSGWVLTAEQRQEMVTLAQAGIPRAEIARKFDVSFQAVHQFLKRRGITASNARLPKMGEMDCLGCGEHFSYRMAHATTAPRMYCSQKCRLVSYRGRVHKNRTYTPRVGRCGYRYVRVPVGHVSEHSHRRRKGWIAEHVLKAETALGRTMRTGEIVHHINGDKLDNRNANLLVCQMAYHIALHARMSLLYQRQTFGRAA